MRKNEKIIGLNEADNPYNSEDFQKESKLNNGEEISKEMLKGFKNQRKRILDCGNSLYSQHYI